MIDAEELAEGGPVVPPGEMIVPGYRAIALLRRGRRLDVYDAWSETRATRCVVKIVVPNRRDDAEVVEDLRREAALLALLDHPHWVRAYELVDGAAPALVIETLGGQTLAAMLDDHGRLGSADVAMLAAQVGSALRYLHAQGWLHLDVTPTNVVVEAGRARLIDLSLAARPGQVRAGMGTSGYRAPEVIRDGVASAASDVHALGSLMLECLSGVTPDLEEPADARPKARPFRRTPEPWLVDLVLACRRDDPAERPSLDEVLRQLHAVP